MDAYQEIGMKQSWIEPAPTPYNEVGRNLVAPTTLIERYKYNLVEAEKRVARLKRLLELLDRNPEIKEVLELTQNL